MAIAGAALRGAGRIFAIGTRPNCVALAKEYGATDIISYKEGDIVEQITALAGRQVDCAILAGGIRHGDVSPVFLRKAKLRDIYLIKVR